MTRGPLWSLVVGSALACSGGPHTVRPLSSDRDVVLKPAPEADLVYLVMVDRFANGDHGNDVGIDLSDPHGWHGGDLRGVLDRLDHLEALGVKTVWLTPVTAARDEKVGEWGAFHGYWLSDPRRMNPRFGTIADLRALSDALHARGMRLVVDMVWNHTDYDAPVRQSHPEWFHTLGDIQDWDDPLQRVRGDVHGLPDLAQENPKVREWLRGSATAWVDRAGLDGLRIDAVGHMPRSFLAHMNRELDAHARKRGNPEGVWTLAEDFTGDPLALAETVEKGGFDAIFDFALHYALLDVTCRGADPLRLASTLSLDRHGPPASARVTFLDNHDLPRVASVCDTSTPAGQARRDAALLLLFALRGTPCLTWGTEAGLSGAEEPENRADFPWGEPAARAPLIAALASERAQHSALSKGDSQVVGAGPGYVRILRRSGTEVALIDVLSPNFDESKIPPLQTRLEVSSVWWAEPAPASADEAALVHHRFERPLEWTAGKPSPSEVAGTGEWSVRVILGNTAPEIVSVQGKSFSHTLVVQVQGAPTTRGLRLVGADPALGAWNPQHAVVPDDPGSAVFHVELRDGDVPVFKAIVVDEDGAVQWSPAPDRAVFLAPDLDTSTVTLDWGPSPDAPLP